MFKPQLLCCRPCLTSSPCRRSLARAPAACIHQAPVGPRGVKMNCSASVTGSCYLMLFSWVSAWDGRVIPQCRIRFQALNEVTRRKSPVGKRLARASSFRHLLKGEREYADASPKTRGFGGVQTMQFSQFYCLSEGADLAGARAASRTSSFRVANRCSKRRMASSSF